MLTKEIFSEELHLTIDNDNVYSNNLFYIHEINGFLITGGDSFLLTADFRKEGTPLGKGKR
jgi:hypothetical protein